MDLKVRTCLWFDRQAEEAAAFYVSLLPGSRIERTMRMDHALSSQSGGVTVVEFTLAGTPYQAMNAWPHDDFEFNDAMSIVVTTQDQYETDGLWDALTADGGKPVQCGWLKDRFGVSWQIVPAALPRLLADCDREAAGRAMQAMIAMQKIDIATIERAFAGEIFSGG
jgi:predicted 3-demethylubiquinone-9 3-methyltransferase (glyoxalase superfamily)